MTSHRHKLQESMTPAFKALIQAPPIAWPTVLVFAMAIVAYATGWVGGLQGWLPIWASILLNTVAVFWFFTVMHDSVHNSVSRTRWLNDWLGRLASVPFSVLPIFRPFRFIHMQHHRFTNEGDNKDPDLYCGTGPTWMLPLRWATIDIKYYVWYVPKLLGRPMPEKREFFLALVINAVALTAIIMAGYGHAFLLYFVIPSRLALTFLAFAFDYLPHSPYLNTQADNAYTATSNRVGLEKLLTPLLLSQNYHLVHHLYPLVPFYRYIDVWKAREDFHMSQRPLLVSVTGRRLDAH